MGVEKQDNAKNKQKRYHIDDALDDDGASYDLSGFFVIGSGGAILSPAVKARIAERLPSVMVIDSLGASETGYQGTNTGVDGEGRPRFAMGEHTTVLGEDNRPVEPGSGIVGRLARGGYVPLGYYKDPEKTASVFAEFEGKRWVLPGDMAIIEADGMITLLGRGSVSINSGGEKIFPEEVESALKSHPDVFDVVVVGLSLGALAAGATVEEIMEVLKLCVVQGVQACNMAVPILAEELELARNQSPGAVR